MTHYIVAGYGSGGTMTPSGVVAVESGANQTFTIQANSNYHINTLTVDGVLVYPALVNHVAYYTYTFYGVTADHTIQVTFSNSHFLAITPSMGGSVNPDGYYIVTYGQSVTVYFYPDDHMFVDYYIIDGVRKNFSQNYPPTSYTITNIVAPHSLYVHFAQRTVYLTISESNVVVADPSGDVLCNEGTDILITITTQSGWTLLAVLVDGVDVGAVTEYTFTHLMESHTMSFQYVFNGGTNATMTGSGTEADPWIILDREDLESIAIPTTPGMWLAEGQYYALGADIDLAGENWIPLGAIDWEAYAWDYCSFVGHLDGRGHIIRNMALDLTEYADLGYVVGMFSSINEPTDGGVSIKNLHLCSATMLIGADGGDTLGLLTGQTDNATIENCSISGTINIVSPTIGAVDDVGGFAGWIYQSSISDCRVDVTINVTSTEQDISGIGGFTGGADTSSMTDCVCNCSIKGSYATYDGRMYDIGGFAGYIDGYRVDSVLSGIKVYCDIDVTIGDLGWGAIWDWGGFSGFSWYGFDIHDCSVSGRIKLAGPTSGDSDGSYYFEIGGFFGGVFGDSEGVVVDTFTRCSSSVDIDIAGGYVSPDAYDDWNFEVGGFCGTAFIGETDFIDCYATGDINIHDTGAISGVNAIGGFIGAGGDYLTHNYYAGTITVPVDAVDVGGVCGRVGSASSPVDDANYWDMEVSTITVSARGTGKTTAEMKTQSTFSGWNFSTTWNIASGTYPFLRTAFVTIRDWCKKISNAIWFVNK